ncbi:MAG: hypothetical protein ACKOCD_06685 [Nitrospiraceae bacterium]
MTELSLHRTGEVQAYAWSWAVSLLVHGLAIGAAVVLVSGLRLAPQPEPFRWVVSKIEPQTVIDRPNQAQPAQVQPGNQTPPAQAQPTNAATTPAPRVPPIQRQSEQPAPE